MGSTTINSKEDPTERIDRKNSTGIQEKRKIDKIRRNTWVDFTRVMWNRGFRTAKRKNN